MKSSWNAKLRGSAALALALASFAGAAGAADAAALRDKWCSKVHIRFFVGGAEGDAFGTIVYNGAKQAAALRLAVHAGHGLTVKNVGAVAAIPEIEELNIGHSIVSNAVFEGLANSVRGMRRAMDAAR